MFDNIFDGETPSDEVVMPVETEEETEVVTPEAEGSEAKEDAAA